MVLKNIKSSLLKLKMFNFQNVFYTLSLKIGKSIRNDEDKARSSQWFSILSIFLTYQLSHQMTCFEHVLFFFIRRPGDLPVLAECSSSGRVSRGVTQYWVGMYSVTAVKFNKPQLTSSSSQLPYLVQSQ